MSSSSKTISRGRPSVLWESKELHRVLRSDLPFDILGQRVAQELRRVVEVVVRPVGRETDAPIVSDELQEPEVVARPLRLFDRLGAVVELAHVVARSFRK